MKKLLAFITLLLVGVLIWFSFIKTYDHQINFEVNLPAGSFYHMLLNSNQWSKKDIRIIDKVLFKSIQMESSINKHDFQLLWELENINNTSAQVHLYYKNKNESLKERFKSLFGQSNNLDTLKVISQSFKQKALSFSKRFQLEINGVETLEKSVFMYVQDQVTRTEMAESMIRNNPILFQKRKDSSVTKNGKTFTKVEHWNPKTDSITFKYAFPVEPKSHYPTDQFVKVDTLHKEKAIKATFHGNYSISDVAWIALHHYAIQNNINIQYSPVEIYHDNPNYGGNSKQWKAEIYMPIKINN